MGGGCTGANGTNPIAPLRSRNASFAKLHPAQKEMKIPFTKDGIYFLDAVDLGGSICWGDAQ